MAGTKNKLRLIIFGIDAADPEVILNNRPSLPNLDLLCRQGAFGRVQSLFWSCDVWTTFYTGLSPEKHGVRYLRLSDPKANQELDPTIPHYLWKVLNSHGLRFGMVEGLYTYPAPTVNGFFWSGKPRLGENYIYPGYLKELVSNQPPDLLPPPLSAYGIKEPFEKVPPEELQKVLEHNYYADYPEHFARKLNWSKQKIEQMVDQIPVDVLFFYTTDIDLFGHFTQHPACKNTVLKVYQALDRFIGEMIGLLNPENVLFVSDHGMQPTAKLFDPSERGYHALRGDYEWCARVLPDGTYVTPWPNGSISTGVHNDVGFYALKGPRIRRGHQQDISFLQVYPLILRSLKLPLPPHAEADSPELFEEFGQERAHRYDRLQWAGNEELLDKFINFVDGAAGEKILDVGTGTGTVAILLKRKGAEVSGIDSSPAMLEKARQCHPGLDLIQGDVRSLPWADAVFDKAVARMVLHHVISGLPGAIREIQRVLKAGGEFAVCEGIPPSPEVLDEYVEIFRLKEERHCFLPVDLRELLEEAGFVKIQEEEWIIPQVSVRNWLENSGLPCTTQDKIFDLHLNASPTFKKLYNLRLTESDILIDMTFLFIKGTKP